MRIHKFEEEGALLGPQEYFRMLAPAQLAIRSP